MKYKVVLSEDARNDIKNFKSYILRQFKYREYAESFSSKMKKALQSLEYFPKKHNSIGYMEEGMVVYYYPCDTYIIVFTVGNYMVYVIRVLKESMYWQSILERVHKIRL